MLVGRRPETRGARPPARGSPRRSQWRAPDPRRGRHRQDGTPRIRRRPGGRDVRLARGRDPDRVGTGLRRPAPAVPAGLDRIERLPERQGGCAPSRVRTLGRDGGRPVPRRARRPRPARRSGRGAAAAVHRRRRAVARRRVDRGAPVRCAPARSGADCDPARRPGRPGSAVHRTRRRRARSRATGRGACALPRTRGGCIATRRRTRSTVSSRLRTATRSR